MRLIIKGTPVAKQSFKTFKGRDGKFHGYLDPNVVQYRDSVKGQILTQLPTDWKMIEGPICINYLEFRFPYLKGFSKSLLNVLEENVFDVGKPNKPDGDNLLKSMGDALNGMVWRDDAQIVVFREVRKVYGQPQIIIDLEEITNLVGKYPLIPKWKPEETSPLPSAVKLVEFKMPRLFGGAS